MKQTLASHRKCSEFFKTKLTVCCRFSSVISMPSEGNDKSRSRSYESVDGHALINKDPDDRSDSHYVRDNYDYNIDYLRNQRAFHDRFESDPYAEVDNACFDEYNRYCRQQEDLKC